MLKGIKERFWKFLVWHIFKLIIEKKKNSQRKLKSLACPNRRMHYNTKYYCISNIVLHQLTHPSCLLGHHRKLRKFFIEILLYHCSETPWCNRKGGGREGKQGMTVAQTTCVWQTCPWNRAYIASWNRVYPPNHSFLLGMQLSKAEIFKDNHREHIKAIK